VCLFWRPVFFLISAELCVCVCVLPAESECEARIKERNLVVGVHNGRTYLQEPTTCSLKLNPHSRTHNTHNPPLNASANLQTPNRSLNSCTSALSGSERRDALSLRFCVCVCATAGTLSMTSPKTPLTPPAAVRALSATDRDGTTALCACVSV
jgi:hypothetical protein